MTQQLIAPPSVVASRTTARRPGIASYLWLAWRQHGGLIVSAVVLTLGLCTALLFAGSALSGVHCQPDPRIVVNGQLPAGSCGNVAQWNMGLYTTSVWLLRVTVFAPLLFGVFFAAPLVSREYESGTHDLAWGQGVSPRQWLRGKLLVLSAITSLLCFVMWLCASPVAASLSRVASFEVGGRFGWEPFSLLAPLLIPYALAALAVGVLCSVLLKKTLPAMALAGVVCLGLGIGTTDVLRPHYVAPKVVHGAIGDDAFGVGGDSLVVSGGWADAHGEPVTGFPRACGADERTCLNAHGIYSRYIAYQPGSREAEFQWIEAGLALLVAGLAGSLAMRRVRPAKPRRRSYEPLRVAPSLSPQPAPAAALRPALRKPGLGSYLWLVWRQHGGLLTASAAVVASLCTALLLAQSDLATTHCTNPWNDFLVTGQCRAVAIDHVTLYLWSIRLLECVVFAPVVLGVVWGAPLVAREHERGTKDIAWGQAISARRWLAGKMAALGLLAVVLTVPLWLCARLVAGSMVRLAPQQLDGAFGWVPFATLSPLVVPYSLVALAIGVLASVMLRRTIPAIVLALAVCVGLGAATADLVRPHYLPPTTAYAPISRHTAGPPDAHNALYLAGFGFADASGHQVTPDGRSFTCASNDAACLDLLGITQTTAVYQPSDREAAFQWIEAGLALGLAGCCTGLALWRLRRR